VCEPTIIMLVASVASAGLSAYGSYQQGQAQKKQAKYAEEVANQQAALTERTAEQNVNLTQESGKFQAKELARKSIALEGEQKGMMAAQGIGGGSVTAQDITRATYDTAKLDELALRYNTDAKSWALKNNAMYQSWDLGTQAKQYGIAGKNYARAGTINVASSLLSGAGSTADIYMKYKM